MSITYEDLQKAYERGREEGSMQEAMAWRESTRRDAIELAIHDAITYQYDECDHGTYSGGAMHGQPYKMCAIYARAVHERITRA